MKKNIFVLLAAFCLGFSQTIYAANDLSLMEKASAAGMTFFGIHCRPAECLKKTDTSFLSGLMILWLF